MTGRATADQRAAQNMAAREQEVEVAVRPPHGLQLLVVELLSPSTALWDAIAKRQAYAEAGIEHSFGQRSRG